MKHAYFFSLAALTLCLASCYEIDDLEQAYKDQYKNTEFKDVSFATHYSDQVTFMRLSFDILHVKEGNKLTLHYTDIEGADPFTEGESIDLTSMLRDIITTPHDVPLDYTLRNLMPETRYWAGFSYSDPGCQAVRSEVVDFKTESIEKRSDCYYYDPYDMEVVSGFKYVPDGSEYGCLIGTDTNLTLEHCLESRKMGSHAIMDSEKKFRETFSGLQPSSTYYFRSYVTYRGRTYYSRCNECTLPEVLVIMLNVKVEQRDGVVYASAYYDDNVDMGHESEGWERGFLVSTDQNVTYDDAIRYPGTLDDSLLNAQITDLTPGKVYYLKAYTVCEGKVELSNQIQFTVY